MSPSTPDREGRPGGWPEPERAQRRRSTARRAEICLAVNAPGAEEISDRRAVSGPDDGRPGHTARDGHKGSEACFQGREITLPCTRMDLSAQASRHAFFKGSSTEQTVSDRHASPITGKPPEARHRAAPSLPDVRRRVRRRRIVFGARPRHCRLSRRRIGPRPVPTHQWALTPRLRQAGWGHLHPARPPVGIGLASLTPYPVRQHLLFALCLCRYGRNRQAKPWQCRQSSH